MFRIAAVGLIVGCVAVGLVAVITEEPDEEKVRIDLSLRPMLVHEAEPSTPIKHSVEWKNVIHTKRHENFAHRTKVVLGGNEFEPRCNRGDSFRMVRIACVGQRRKTVRPFRMLSGDGTQNKFTVGEAEFFLSKTQRLREGAPAEPPKGISHFVAFRVLGRDREESNDRTDDGRWASVVRTEAAGVRLSGHARVAPRRAFWRHRCIIGLGCL